MVQFILFLHVLGAVGMGFYLFLPLLVSRIGGLSAPAQEGFVSGLASANRFAQFMLIVQFLTGGYLISQSKYTVVWMVLIIVLFLAVAAVGGIMSKPMKGLISAVKAGRNGDAEAKKLKTFSFIVWILFVAILVFMKYPMYA